MLKMIKIKVIPTQKYIHVTYVFNYSRLYCSNAYLSS